MSNGIEKCLKQENLQPLIAHIEKYYEGNVLILTEWLERAIYMILLIPEDDEFTTLHKRNVCGAILGVKESLMNAYFESQDLEYEKFE